MIPEGGNDSRSGFYHTGFLESQKGRVVRINLLPIKILPSSMSLYNFKSSFSFQITNLIHQEETIKKICNNNGLKRS